MSRPLPSAAELFGTHGDYVCRVVGYLGVPTCDVADLVQEVFVVVLRRGSTYRQTGSVRSWLAGIARNLVRDHKKRAHRRWERSSDALDDAAAEGEDPEREARFREALCRLDEVLAGLGAEQRLVFLLHDVEEMAMKEITDAMGTPLQTGYSRLRAARTRVRERARSLGLEPT